VNRREQLVASFMALCLCIAGCHHAVPSASTSGPQAGAGGAAKTRAIVFVHGIHGDPRGTWTSDDGTTYWPDLVRADKDFADADVYVEGYPTPYTGNRSDVTDISNSLASRLTPVFAGHKQVIFICHSLGGLLVEQLLVDHPNFASEVPFVVFYATPHAGSFVASFSSVFEGDPLLRSMSSSGDNQYLLELEDRWRGAKFSTHRFCAFETIKMRPHNLAGIVGAKGEEAKLLDFVGGIYVVDPFSATYGCDSNAPFTGIQANHIDIVKPTNRGDAIYKLFKEYYLATNVPLVEQPQAVRFEKTLCAFYGEAVQGASAWNKDERCPVADRQHLDPDYHQTDFNCCGGGAGSTMTNANVPVGLELRVDGGHYWSVDRALFDGDTYQIHTYCGPEPAPGPGCNVKLKIVAHYKIVIPGGG
jgi:pimeloyl-ACP methyl ester carboxylesterase